MVEFQELGSTREAMPSTPIGHTTPPPFPAFLPNQARQEYLIAGTEGHWDAPMTKTAFVYIHLP
jgi:hypothetical protein